MAELDVEPKRRSSIFPWLLLGLGVIALLFFLTRRSDDRDVERAATTTTTATSTTSHAAAANSDQRWEQINFNAPAANYNEITDRNIVVRGTTEYAVYSLDDDVLFEDDKSTLRPDAAKNLQQVANSIEQRFTNGQIRVYGDADENDNDADDRQLAQQRAEVIRNWLAQNGNIQANRISIHPATTVTGTTDTTGTNRRQKEDIAIVARRS